MLPEFCSNWSIVQSHSSHNHSTCLSIQLDLYLTLRNTRSSSVFTLSRPAAGFVLNLNVTNRSFDVCHHHISGICQRVADTSYSPPSNVVSFHHFRHFRCPFFIPGSKLTCSKNLVNHRYWWTILLDCLHGFRDV